MKIPKENFRWIFFGILLMNISVIVARYVYLPDFGDGLLKDMSIGLIILGFNRHRFKKAC